MSDFAIHTTETRPVLEAAAKKFGFVPNLLGMLAESPAAAETYMALSGLFDKTAFTPVERQVIALTISYLNDCTYCVGAHSAVAKQARMDDDVLAALRAGTELPDPRLQALRGFTAAIVGERGFASPRAVHEFLDAGFTKAQVLDVIVGIAFKTVSNYTNHITQTPLDDAFAPFAWEKNLV